MKNRWIPNHPMYSPCSLLGFLACACFLIAPAKTYPAANLPRPNILWITAEDLSPHLGCYGDRYARTPQLDAFARDSVRYTHAFATAPVCSPARSCLITGMYATSLGTQRLRSQFPVPKFVRGFPAYLREAGYYTANNVKTDYNLHDEPAFVRDAWDDCSTRAHWRGRRPNRPFFAVFNLMTTHQSRTSVWPHDQFEAEIGSKLSSTERHDPAHAPLPPYYPDTPEARQAWARYHDCITRMDQEVGDLLQQLAEDGLADSTIVFFYGDHGMGMPRGKRCLWDSGLQVPLLIRFPEKYRSFAPAAPGRTTSQLVSFVDFAPTVLSSCGIPFPSHMQGSPFLGTARTNPRQFVFGARDRVDEAFDLSRSVRDHRHLYIRNFMPHLSWMQPEAYSDGSTFRRELKRLAAEGQLAPPQLTYAAARKPVEELYDTDADPHQLRNLAAATEHQTTLDRLRRELREWMLATHDTGFLTEAQVWERIGTTHTPFNLARDHTKYPIRRLLEAASLVGDPTSIHRQMELLQDPDDGVRYWAALGLHAAAGTTLKTSARSALRTALSDSCDAVRIEAAAALARSDASSPALSTLELALQSNQRDVVLHAARNLQLLGEQAQPVWPAMRQVLDRARQQEAAVGDPARFLRFSLEAALTP